MPGNWLITNHFVVRAVQLISCACVAGVQRARVCSKDKPPRLF